MATAAWYELKDPAAIDSPALLFYKARIASNIDAMVCMAGSANRLMPHVKTHKCAEIVKMQLQAGIRQFKCATIAEAEMLADAGAQNILLAYQLTMPKARRFISLVKKYPAVQFASLADNYLSAQMLNNLCAAANTRARVFIDVDAGMHRTGIAADDLLFELYTQIIQLPNTDCLGLHIYDGHVRDADLELRTQQVQKDFAGVHTIANKIKEVGYPAPLIIAGGTPSFSVHALDESVICSPGTCVLCDEGYRVQLPEQPFLPAAVLLTRVASKPMRGLVTTDLGHKSVAAENAIDRRIFFLNLEEYTVRSQSEEHLVLEVNNWDSIRVGDVLYGVPYHVCPTVALYDEAHVIVSGDLADHWNIIARKRKLTV